MAQFSFKRMLVNRMKQIPGNLDKSDDLCGTEICFRRGRFGSLEVLIWQSSPADLNEAINLVERELADYRREIREEVGSCGNLLGKQLPPCQWLQGAVEELQNLLSVLLASMKVTQDVN